MFLIVDEINKLFKKLTVEKEIEIHVFLQSTIISFTFLLKIEGKLIKIIQVK